MNNKLFLAMAAFAILPHQMQAQRKTMDLGRGVVAAYRDNSVTITWRRLAQEPEDAVYNIYVDKAGGENYTRIKTTTLTNFATSLSAVPYGSSIAVTMTGADGVEGEKSLPFRFVDNAWPNAAIKVNFAKAGSPITTTNDFAPKFVWPVDLDGDGEMEYVINRIYGGKVMDGFTGHGADKLGGDYLEAYTRDGRHIWSVNLGPHFFSFSGQNDGVTVGDFDGDGKGEVMIHVAEGARFWDKEKNTFGKYLYYNGEQASSTGGGMQTVASDGSNPDIDGDGITNYTWYDQGKNPQWYIAVIDGMTGAQKDVCPMTMPKDNDMTYTRTNKSAFMRDEYSYTSPEMGSAFLNGVDQSAVAQFQVRTTNGSHHYFTYAYGYEGGAFRELFRFPFHDNGSPSEFHHIRIGDVDGDGKDEVMNGAYALDHDGKMLWNSGVAHGDRFRLSDIDPDRPGQEIFAIQQNAPDMLGMILYDATDGSSIKRWYMGSVGDVGRGECMDVDPEHKGYEMWSTMPNMYNAKGEVIIEGPNKAAGLPYPLEGTWWDGNLDRECTWENGSNDHNIVVGGWSRNSGNWGRMCEFSKESGWKAHGEYGGRVLFWGDILGDWREEIMLKTNDDKGNFDGFVLYTTNYTTDVDDIYCLLEDPNYFGQITNRGYYQSPMTSFYLGFDMPRPPLPPVMKDGDRSKVYGISLGNAAVEAPAPGIADAYYMPVKGQTLTMAGAVSGKVNLWKSQPGTLVLNGDVATTGKVIVSQGTLEVNGNVNGVIDLRARGILSGKGTVKGIAMEGSLNYAEGVIKPDGTLTVASDLVIDKPAFVEIDIDKNTLLKVGGNLDIQNILTFNISSRELKEGTYRLIEYQGAFKGGLDKCKVRGIVGQAYTIEAKDNAVVLTVAGTREPAEEVLWTGDETLAWDYNSRNWSVGGEQATFVAGDAVVFGDNTRKTTITIEDKMPASVKVSSTQNYTIKGNGGITGEGGLEKNGSGKLTLAAKNSDYTGATIINEGTVVLSELSMQGSASSIGVGSKAPAKWLCGKATMTFDGASLATDRGITLTDTATFNIPSTYSTTMKGMIIGNGMLRKTGAGQLSISYNGANGYDATILEQGTIAQGTYTATLGKVNNTLFVKGDSRFIQFYTTDSGNAPSFSHNIDIDTLKTLTFVGSGRGRITTKLSGKGTIKLSSAYVRFDQFLSGEDFRGMVSLGSGAGRLAQDMTMKKATFNIEGGVTAEAMAAGGSKTASYTFHVGNVTGDGNLGAGTWNVGYADKDATYNGAFSKTVSKYGTGAWTLTGASSAPLNVYEGSVNCNNTSANTTTGLVTVYGGAAVRGLGQTASISLKDGATIGVAKKSALETPATFTVNGNVTGGNGNILEMKVYTTAARTQHDQIAVSGNVTLASPVIAVSESRYSTKSMEPGTELLFINYGGKLTVTGDVTITPAVPCAGCEWDLSSFPTEGTIRVVQSTAIRTVNAAELSSEDIICDVAGRRVGRISSPGTYIVNGVKVRVR